MFNLKVTKADGSIEQSDFLTEQECLDWQAHLGEIGYTDCTFEIIAYAKPIEDISPRQIRLVLLASGITEASIDGAIAVLESPLKEQAMIAWKYSTSFKRDVPIIAAIGKLLGLSSEQLDALWIKGKDL